MLRNGIDFIRFSTGAKDSPAQAIPWPSKPDSGFDTPAAAYPKNSSIGKDQISPHLPSGEDKILTALPAP